MTPCTAQEILEKSDTLIYRYRNFNEFSLNELVNSKLYFSSLDSFNDPFEVSELVCSDLPKLSTDGLRKEIHRKGYSCFCRYGDNLNMWAHYANGLRGMCFVYDAVELYNSLIELNPDHYQFDFLKVNYLGKTNSLSDIINDESLTTYMKLKKISVASSASKLKVFELEDEARIIISRLNYDDIADDENLNYFNSDGSVHSHELNFSRKSLKKIIFGKKMSENQRSIVRNLLIDRDVILEEAITLQLINVNTHNVLQVNKI
jgi:hypothetical protein